MFESHASSQSVAQGREGSLKKILFSCMVAGGLVFTAPGFAADMAIKAPRLRGAAAVDPWSGFYAGVSVGYAWDAGSAGIAPNEILRGIGAGSLPYGPLPGKPNDDSFTAGGQIGYNARFGNVLAGVEADLSYLGMQSSSTATGDVFIGGTFQTTLETRLDWLSTIRGRLGVVAADNLLVYATGGLAFAEVEVSGRGFNLLGCAPAAYCLAGTSNDISTGWTLGGGFEYALAPQWTVKAEYLHVDLGGQSVTFFDPATPGGSLTATATTRLDKVRIGLNYQFR